MGDVDRMRALGTGPLGVLLDGPRVDRARVAAIGYCFGGTMVLELARTGADLKAVVGFHPGLYSTRPDDSANIVGKVLMCVGADDPLIPSESRLAFEDEMRAAGVDWRINLYGGAKHSFTNPHVARFELPVLEYHRPLLTSARGGRCSTSSTRSSDQSGATASIVSTTWRWCGVESASCVWLRITVSILAICCSTSWR